MESAAPTRVPGSPPYLLAMRADLLRFAARSRDPLGFGWLDDQGLVVGVAFMVSERGQNLNFAVPADWIANVRARSATNPLTEAMQRSMAPN